MVSNQLIRYIKCQEENRMTDKLKDLDLNDVSGGAILDKVASLAGANIPAALLTKLPADARARLSFVTSEEELLALLSKVGISFDPITKTFSELSKKNSI